jgi:hypothetical protein
MITVPDELGTETDELLNQRLTQKGRERKHQYSKKLDSKKQKRSEKQRVDSIEKYFAQKRRSEQLTSSRGGVVEPPSCRADSVAGSTLALFGEGAQGLAGGVGCSMFC